MGRTHDENGLNRFPFQSYYLKPSGKEALGGHGRDRCNRKTIPNTSYIEKEYTLHMTYLFQLFNLNKGQFQLVQIHKILLYFCRQFLLIRVCSFIYKYI